MHPVSTDVNNARTTGSHLVERIEEPAGERPAACVQGTLL
jgi:hypothetical protein